MINQYDNTLSIEFGCTKTITLLVDVKSDLPLSNFAIKRLSRRPNSETTRDLSLKASWQLSAAAAADDDNDNNNTMTYVVCWRRFAAAVSMACVHL